MRLLALVCAACAAFGQQSVDPMRVLSRAQARLSDAAAAVPKYTCTQTVDRSYFRQARQPARPCDAIVANQRAGRSKLSLAATDRLRFDVEVADGGYEIYAWPGAARIEGDKIEEMAGGGPLGTGPFGPFLVDIFRNPAVQFQYLGEAEKLLEYRYRVPLTASHYRVQAGVKWRTTAYDGTLRLDAGSAELKRLTVRTDELSADTGSCEATTTMDFEPLRIGEGEYLIPRKTRLDVIGRDAGLTENATVYADCHEFRGESVVRFDQPIPATDSGPTLSIAGRRPGLPANLPVVLILAAEIDTDRAAAGDAVRATLGRRLVDPASKRVLAEAGSLVHGRITHMEHHLEGDNYFLVGLSFESLESPGGEYPVAIILDSSIQVRDSRPPHGSNVRSTASRSGFQGGGSLVFPASQGRCVVPRGYASNWLTVVSR